MELAAGSLEAYRQAQYGKEDPPEWVTSSSTQYPRLYMDSFPTASRSIKCTVGGCEGWDTTGTNLHIHLVHHHMWDTVVILE